MKRLAPGPWSLAAVLALSTAYAQPIEQHLTLNGPSGTSAVVVWTDATSAKESVSYGTTTSYGSSKNEPNNPFQVPGEAMYSHHVPLTGLAAGTTYHYRVTGGADQVFTTDPGTGTFSFVAYGDQGTTATISTTQGGGCGISMAVAGSGGVNGVPEATATQAAGADAGLALYLGDCSYANGSSSALWDAWFNANTPLAQGADWLVTLGNHDFAGPQGPGTALDGQNFFGRLFYPAPFASNVGWWSTDFGGVHFIFLSGDEYANTTQQNWLKADLGTPAAQSANWRIVMVHQPAFSSSCDDGTAMGDPYEQGVRKTLVPIFDAFASTAHVDLVLQGHRHVYERSYMLTSGSQEAPVINTAAYSPCTNTYSMPAGTDGGTVYVTTGGGGHDLHGWATTSPPAWSMNRNSFFHWLQVWVTPQALTVDVHDTQAGSIYETFTITRGSAASCGSDGGTATDGGTLPDGGRLPDGGSAFTGAHGSCGCATGSAGVSLALALVGGLFLLRRRRAN